MASPRQTSPQHEKSSKPVTVAAADQNLASSSADLVQRVKSHLLNLQCWEPQQISFLFHICHLYTALLKRSLQSSKKVRGLWVVFI